MISLEGDRALLFNPREGMQTPPPVDGRLDNPSLSPPCQLVAGEVLNLLETLQQRPDLLVELPTPSSCPSAAHLVRSLLRRADELGVADRTPSHIRISLFDSQLAIACGAQAIHAYGNSSTLADGRGKPVDEWLRILSSIAQEAYMGNVTHLRASLEQITHTPVDVIAQFLRGIQEINNKYNRRIINAVGLPDTNGVAKPDDYKKILRHVEHILHEADLTLFFHLHNDRGHALDTAREIMEIVRRQNIPVVVETVLDTYPGERVGLEPTVSHLAELGFTLPLPENVYNVLQGASWVLAGEGRSDVRSRAELTHVAGVHTDHMERYTNGDTPGYPSPGMYTIMGKNNIAFLQEHILRVLPSDLNVLRAAALVGRELASQLGNKPQAYAIALAQLTNENPELVVRIAESFGSPETWLRQPLPDIQMIHNELERIILARWGNSAF